MKKSVNNPSSSRESSKKGPLGHSPSSLTRHHALLLGVVQFYGTNEPSRWDLLQNRVTGEQQVKYLWGPSFVVFRMRLPMRKPKRRKWTRRRIRWVQREKRFHRRFSQFMRNVFPSHKDPRTDEYLLNDRFDRGARFVSSSLFLRYE